MTTPSSETREGKRRSGRVLVVDDDALVASSMRRMLAREHAVTVVADGKEALDLLLGGAEFDVILCDLMMPNMTGMDLHAELSQRKPEVVERMVFVTGDPYTPAARKFLDSVSNQWLEKPCPPQRLQGVVRGFLE